MKQLDKQRCFENKEAALVGGSLLCGHDGEHYGHSHVSEQDNQHGNDERYCCFFVVVALLALMVGRLGAVVDDYAFTLVLDFPGSL